MRATIFLTGGSKVDNITPQKPDPLKEPAASGFLRATPNPRLVSFMPSLRIRTTYLCSQFVHATASGRCRAGFRPGRRLERWISWTLLLILLGGAWTSVRAARARPLNLEEMTQHADRIFSGRCVNVRVARDPELDQTVTYVTFAPHRVEKGRLGGSVTIKLLGDQGLDGPRIAATEGVPAFRKGEEVVLFLYADSRRGLTSPVGFGQGKFIVIDGKDGRPLALNEFANERLLDNLSPAAGERLGEAIQRLRGRKAIPPDDLLDLVRSLRP